MSHSCVPSWQRAHSTPHQRFPDYARIGSVESVCGGIATRAGRSSCSVVDARRRSRGRSRSLPNPSPDLVTGEQLGSVVNERRDGNVDRQCGFVCQVEPPIQPHVNSWCWELSARCGMRAQRVREASPPGPRSQNCVDADQDDLPDTVPASQMALHEVGRLVCQEQVPMHDSDALVDHGHFLGGWCCTVIRRHPEIGSGQVTRNVNAR